MLPSNLDIRAQSNLPKCSIMDDMRQDLAQYVRQWDVSVE